MSKNRVNENRSLTYILRGTVYSAVFDVFSVCAILLPELAREEAEGKTKFPPAYPFLIGAWIISIPVFAALRQTLRLIGFIDGNRAFTKQSVKVLQAIKSNAIVFGIMVTLAASSIIVLARSTDPTEDITPVFTIGSLFIFVSAVIAAFTAVLQRLLQEAIIIKSENDLTV